jgi:hypothetical protein
MDSSLIWLSLVVGGGLLAIIAGVFIWNRVRPRPSELSSEERAEIEGLPMTPLQKRAWWDLGIGVAASIAIVSIFIYNSPTEYFDNTAMRLTVMALFMGALIAHVMLLYTFRQDWWGKGYPIDERDKIILSRAPQAQSVSVIIALVIWAIALTEAYRDEGGIPIVFPTLIFGSIFIVNMLAYTIGILVGYRIAPYNGQG